MNGNIIAMSVAMAAMAFMNIGQSVQKLGSNGWHSGKNAGSLVLWGAGILMTTLSSFITMAAVSLGDVTLVGAMAGTGLPFMVAFSLLILKEPVGPAKQYLGILLILVSAIFIGLFKNPSIDGRVSAPAVWIMLATVLVVFTGLIAYGWYRFRKISGLWLSALAGCLRGFVPLFQKVAVSPLGKRGAPNWTWLNTVSPRIAEAAKALTNPYTITWMLVVTLSMVVFQFAHKLDTAMRNIPSFTVAFVVLPVLGGVVAFGENPSPVLLAGVSGILTGNVLVTRQANKGVPA